MSTSESPDTRPRAGSASVLAGPPRPARVRPAAWVPGAQASGVRAPGVWALVSVVLVVLAMVIPGVAGGGAATVLTPAGAVEPAPDAGGEQAPDVPAVEIIEVSPQVVDPDGTVVVQAVLRNESDEPIRHPQGYLWHDTGMLTTSEELQAAGGFDATFPVGRRHLPSMVELSDPDPLTGEAGELAPGESVPVRVHAPVAELELSAEEGVALIGVQIRAETDEGWQTVARDRILLPVASDTDPDTALTSVVALNSTPSRITPDLFMDDHLAAEIAPGGRLDELLTTAEATGRTGLIDPALLVELQDMADGYQVLLHPPQAPTDTDPQEPGNDAPGTEAPPTPAEGGTVTHPASPSTPDAQWETTEGQGEADAQAWLDRFTSYLQRSTSEVYRLPYATADPNLLSPPHHLTLWHTATAQDSLPDQVAELPVGVLPGGDTISRTGLEVVDSTATTGDLILASNVADPQAAAYALPHDPAEAPADAPPAQAPAEDTPPEGSGTVLVPFDGAAFALGPQPEPRDSVVQLRQSMLAAANVATVQSDPAHVRVITGLHQAQADREDRRTRTQLSELVSDSATPVLDPDNLSEVTEEPDRQVELTSSIAERRGLDTLTDDAVLAADLTTRPVLALSSATWRWRPESFQQYAVVQDRTVARISEGDALHLSARSVILTARESTQFPVTVTNDLDVPVTVRLSFNTENEDRFRVPDVDTLDVGPGESVTVSVTPEVNANGTYEVQAIVATPSGRPLGEPVSIEVQATQAGRVGWVLMIVSGAVVIGTTVLRIRQVRHERANAEVSGPDPFGEDAEPCGVERGEA